MEIKNQPKCRLKNFHLKSNLICNTITEGGYRECPYNLWGVCIRQVMFVTGNTGKNNGFPFLDILGYLKNTHKIPNLAKWDKSQPGNSQPSSLVGTCLTLPNLGFLWVFFKYPKISKNGREYTFYLNTIPNKKKKQNISIVKIKHFF